MIKLKPRTLASSSDFESIQGCIAQFYCTTADRIKLSQVRPELKQFRIPEWSVKVGDKELEGVHVTERKHRFYFAMS
jgi:hypothetical protein